MESVARCHPHVAQSQRLQQPQFAILSDGRSELARIDRILYLPQGRAHATAAARTGTYAACWTVSQPVSAATPGYSLLFTSRSSPREKAKPIPSSRAQAAAAMLAGSDSASPSLQGVTLAVALAQQLAGHAQPPRVLVATSGALAFGAACGVSGAAHGGAWGFARVLRLEHAEAASDEDDD